MADTTEHPDACSRCRHTVAHLHVFESRPGLPFCVDCAAEMLAAGDVDECRAESPHGDVCVRAKDHDGLCRSGVGRKHVSSPEKAGKPWHWYRADARALDIKPPEVPHV